MGRPPRIHYPGAIYHVMGRGNQGKSIFFDTPAKKRFLRLLGAASKRYETVLHAYCVMTNHFHLLVQVGEMPLGKMMQVVLGRFGRYFNWRLGTSGHAFQDRYKAIVCERDAYLLTLLRYIHLNPVRAGIVNNADEWPWSSHLAYLGSTDSIVSTEFCLSLFSGPRSSCESYASFIAASAPAVWPHSASRPWREAEASMPNSIGFECRKVPAALEDLLVAFCRGRGLAAATLIGSSRAQSLIRERRKFIDEALSSGYRLADIGRVLRRARSTVAMAVTRKNAGPTLVSDTNVGWVGGRAVIP